MAADVLVAALSRVSPAAVRFRSMPPKTVDPNADTIGVFVPSRQDFALVLTDEIVRQVATVLTDPRGLAWPFDATDEAMEILAGLAARSGGGFATPVVGIVAPRVSPHAVEAFRAAASPDLGFPRVVVTADRRATALRTWRPRGVPWPRDEVVGVLSGREFRDLVAHARWGLRPS